MTTRIRVALALAVVVPALGFGVVSAATGGSPSWCDQARDAASARRSHDTGSGPDVVVIGDSWSVGLGTSAADSWPTRLPGRVHVDGFSGSGFSATSSDCGPQSYAARADRAVAGHPGALVVVEGGLNDFDQTDAAIEQGVADLVGRLDGHRVVVVGPAAAPSRAAEVPRVDAVLEGAAERAGVTYLSMAGADVTYLDDELHPTAAGHRAFGDAVAAALAHLGRG